MMFLDQINILIYLLYYLSDPEAFNQKIVLLSRSISKLINVFEFFKNIFAKNFFYSKYFIKFVIKLLDNFFSILKLFI